MEEGRREMKRYVCSVKPKEKDECKEEQNFRLDDGGENEYRIRMSWAR